jgi:spermidine synthase
MNLVIFALFFVSGACGLIYEVAWSRIMQFIFGRGSLAVGIVLAAFMSGLAFGSYLLGKYNDKAENPLRLYAFYEIGIGITALLATFLLYGLIPVYVQAHTWFGHAPAALAVSQFFIAFLPLIAPTVLMGATLPVLSRIIITQLHRVDRQLGHLYVINTAGAVAGSLLSGFFLIKHLGLHGTVYLAVAGNISVGVLAVLASMRYKAAAAPASVKPAKTAQPVQKVAQPSPVGGKKISPRQRLILWTFAFSGFASFAYEIFWTRSLVFLVGNTTYAFSLMLAAFLTGIALGGYGIRFVVKRTKRPLMLFAAIEVLIGIFSAASLPLLFSITKSGAGQSFVTSMSGQLGSLILANFGVAVLLMLPPATLIGTTFPLMGRIFVDDLKSTGAVVGKVYSVNTVGNVLGALLPGLLILPLMGIEKGILLMAALNVCLGAAIVLSRWKGAAVSAVAASALFMLASVVLVHTSLGFQFPSEDEKPKDEMLYYREGSLVTTKVWEDVALDYKEISVDGINIGGTSSSDYKQEILAHLPKLLLKSYKTELSVGLGSGILAGESARHAQLKKITCVEISRGVVEGARYFSKENYNILNDPRAVIVTQDIIDFLQTTKGRYDIISADEKTAGRYATNSMSYSGVYYALLRRHLAPGGLVIQWMPTELPPSQYDLAMRTFVDSFPHVSIWYFPPVGRFTMSNTFLVGSNERIDIDPAAMDKAFAKEPEAFQGIKKYGLTSAGSVLAHYISSGVTARKLLPPGPVNTFDKPYYEFYSPADYAMPANERILANHEMLMKFRVPDLGRVVANGGKTPDLARLNQDFQAEGKFFKGLAGQLMGDMAQNVDGRYEQAVGMAPADLNLRNEYVCYLNSQVRALGAEGDYNDAAAILRHAADIYPESPEVHFDYGNLLVYLNDTQEGVKELQQAVALNPGLVPALRNLGEIYASKGDVYKAVELWKRALSIDPNDVVTLVYYGRYLEQSDNAEGEIYLERARRLAPNDFEKVNG